MHDHNKPHNRQPEDDGIRDQDDIIITGSVRPNPRPEDDGRYYQATQQQLRRAKSTNGFAIASLVCAIIGIGWYAPLILGPLAVLFGHIARGQIRREGQDGNGLAIAGLLMGYLQFVFLGCLPAFLEYDTRNQLTEAYGELGIPLAKLGDEIAAGKKNAGFTLPPSSRYWQEAYTRDGTVYARLKTDSSLPSSVSGNTIVYTPRIHNGTVSWRCDFAGDIQRSYLPRKCAGVKTE
ncbi:Uncharacterised protein [Kingella potus]|uniref:DUF4190 domain-containing protein n=1 Tax=Kingella potus TaxID=265175 RepID=A0A377R001_9NEIS|nr:DUF4190 domain-containing protein [Kingella potus]STR00335.1 Uncharacterised protein [Kingella potus]